MGQTVAREFRPIGKSFGKLVTFNAPGVLQISPVNAADSEVTSGRKFP